VSDKFSGELDPQIASLIGLTSENSGIPNFNDLTHNEFHETSKTPDLAIKQFALCTQFLGKPHPAFQDKDFYKKILNNEGEPAKRVHENFTKFVEAKDPADKSLYRGKLIPAFWDLGASIARKLVSNPVVHKNLFLRFGLLSPSFLSPEQQDMISKIIFKNETGEPIYYLDEWLLRIAHGLETISLTDELKQSKKDPNQKLIEKVDKTKGQRDSELALLMNKTDQRSVQEIRLQDSVSLLIDHTLSPTIDGIAGPYTESQKKLITQISESLKQLFTIDRDISRAFSTLIELNQNLGTMDKPAEDLFASSEVDSSHIVSEFNTVRQMAKLCVGRKGNHFPVLMKSYFRSSVAEIGIRENIINELAYVESLDTQLFFRTFKNQTNRIVPSIILLSNYGELGICWEPFERHNKATSRGRLAIPMFPKNLRVAVISACADLRWQVAKEKAQHYWMEEGITGRYYIWYQEKKMRGDVRMAFINDYILWITKESEGVQKLDRDVRGIFWRLIPFPQEVKEKIRNRGFVYNELYKKDVNISKSDGY